MYREVDYSSSRLFHYKLYCFALVIFLVNGILVIVLQPLFTIMFLIFSNRIIAKEKGRLHNFLSMFNYLRTLMGTNEGLNCLLLVLMIVSTKFAMLG